MVEIYLVRHGKTMFNTIGRTQGWCDTPLTAAGEEGIVELGLGLKAENICFDRAYSSDSGRTIQTLMLILEHSENLGIPHTMDRRIREWCFGSFEGGYDHELFDGVLPRLFVEEGLKKGVIPSYEEIARSIKAADSAGWAEDWQTLSGRLMTGFTDIAKEAEREGAQNIVVVSHSMSICTFLSLLLPGGNTPRDLENGSVTRLTWTDGKFSVGEMGDTHYRATGREILDKQK